VKYTIAFQNAGNSSVDNFSVIDELPKYTEYIENSVMVNGIPIQDNSGIISITKNLQGNTVIAVSIGKVNSKSSGSVEFNVKVK
jgi:uncharacterized repeat protein (TIGR01451 family)